MRWVASVYRDALHRVAPGICRQVDELMAQAGRPIHPNVDVSGLSDDEVLPAKIAAQVSGFSERTLSEYRRAGVLRGTLQGRAYGFKLFDLREFMAWHSGRPVQLGTCKVTADGGSLPGTQETTP